MDDAQTAIRRLYAASVTALNAGDLPALSAFYTDDAIQLPPDRPPVVGWEAIRSSLERELREVTVEAVVDVREVSVAGGLAYALGRHRIRVTSRGGGPGEVTEGSWLDVLRRGEDDSWRIARSAWSDHEAPMRETPR
ncbi:MAG: SgcJ/EcaC family oxidoreductase [Gemmatimonadota bacterium]|jgi:uncharacterized protein (TIGR02246 family)